MNAHPELVRQFQIACDNMNRRTRPPATPLSFTEPPAPPASAWNLARAAKQIKDRATVDEVARWYDYDYSAPGGRFPCLMCQSVSSSRKTLGLLDGGRGWFCHHCQQGGDVIDWMAAVMRCGKGEAIASLCARFGIVLNDRTVAGFLASLRQQLAGAGEPASVNKSLDEEFWRYTARWWRRHESQFTVPAEVPMWAGHLYAAEAEAYHDHVAKGESGIPALEDLLARLVQSHEDVGISTLNRSSSTRWANHRKAMYNLLVDEYRGLVGCRETEYQMEKEHALQAIGKRQRHVYGKIGIWTNRIRCDESDRGEIPELFRKQTPVLLNRIVVPLCEPTGAIVAFAGRSYMPTPGQPAGPKWLQTRDTEIFKKRNFVYGVTSVGFSPTVAHRIHKCKFAVVVEGYFDQMVLRDTTDLPVVGSLGTALTPQQVELLYRLGARSIVTMHDGDDAGAEATARARDTIHGCRMGHGAVRLPKGLDPDDVAMTPNGPKVLEAAVASALEKSKPHAISNANFARVLKDKLASQ